MAEFEPKREEPTVNAAFRMHRSALENVLFLAAARRVSPNDVIAQAVATEFLLASLLVDGCTLQVVQPDGEVREVEFDPRQNIAPQELRNEDIDL